MSGLSTLSPFFYDTETCGLYGVPVLIQYAQGSGPIQLYNFWTNPIAQSLELIETLMNNKDGVIGFNLAFDHFHLTKMYNLLSLWPDKDELPENIIDDLGMLEASARDGVCLKPVKACDIMLHARRGPYQATMDRGDIRIRRVPTAIAWELADELESRLKFKDIYFARKKDKNAKRWTVYDIKDSDGELIRDFKDIVLSFAPSVGLKALAVDALGIQEDVLIKYLDIEVDKAWYPEEHGYAPFATAIGDRHNWNKAWPEVIRHHISHWEFNSLAREYGLKDVEYTRALWHYFGCPSPGDDDSELACMVAAVRWKGYKIDVPKIKALRERALKQSKDTPTAPAQAREYVTKHMGITERTVLKGSTKKVLLEEISTWKVPCPDCNADAELDFETEIIDAPLDKEYENDLEVLTTVIKPNEKSKDCKNCSGTGHVMHPAARAAQDVLDARAADKEVEIFDKLLLAGRFHASFKVIGALSGRMAGADGFNPQGVKKTKEVRQCFDLAFDDMILSGGDFSGFEVTIAEAVYNDVNLRKSLLTCEVCEGEASWNPDKNDFICKNCGSNKQKKIHALFGVHCFPEYTYETLKATSGSEDDKYTKAKSGVFAIIYGGTEHTLADRLGVPIEIGSKALKSFHRTYPGVGESQVDIFNSFCSMRQPGGIGSKVEWHDPADYRETMFGFRRYFTLENQIAKVLFTLANAPPKRWRDIKIKVVRRDRVQSASGAVQSALYGAAFQIQAANMRAATNHDIQSAGATITKHVQRKIWDLQPSGVSEWKVIPMNVHDEIMCPSTPEMVSEVKGTVLKAVETFREKIPLIKMDWKSNLESWAGKS